jgi:hypothetical protein
VFVAPYLEQKHKEQLVRALQRLVATAVAMSAQDSILIVPIANESVKNILCMGNNNAIDILQTPIKKTII